MRAHSTLLASCLVFLGSASQADQYTPAARSFAELHLDAPLEQTCASFYGSPESTEDPPGATVLAVYVTATGAIGRTEVRSSSGLADAHPGLGHDRQGDEKTGSLSIF